MTEQQSHSSDLKKSMGLDAEQAARVRLLVQRKAAHARKNNVRFLKALGDLVMGVMLENPRLAKYLLLEISKSESTNSSAQLVKNELNRIVKES